MFNPSRGEALQFFCETWRKYRAGEALSGLEQVTFQLLALHPEYHEVLECLAETLWQAQRNSTVLDEKTYLDCLSRRG